MTDVINNFQYGTDRLVMIDTSNDGDPINTISELIADGDRPAVGLVTGGTNSAYIIGVTFTFDVDGDGGGKVLTINFDTSDETKLLNYGAGGLQYGGITPQTLTNYNQLEDLLFDGMIDFITPDELPSLLAFA